MKNKILCYIGLENGDIEKQYLTIEELTNSNYKVVIAHQNWQGVWTTLHNFEEKYIQFKDTNPTIWLKETKYVGACEMKSFNT